MLHQPRLLKILATFLLTLFSASLVPVPANANAEIFERFVGYMCPQTTYITVKRNVISCVTGAHIRTEVVAVEEHNTPYEIRKCGGSWGLCINDEECGPSTQHFDQWLATICE